MYVMLIKFLIIDFRSLEQLNIVVWMTTKVLTTWWTKMVNL